MSQQQPPGTPLHGQQQQQQQQHAVAAQQQHAAAQGSAGLPLADQLTLLQFRYTAALEKLVHANDQVAKLLEEKNAWAAERGELQGRLAAAGLLGAHPGDPHGQGGHLQQQQHQHAALLLGGGVGGPGGNAAGQDFQLDPSLLPSGGVYGQPYGNRPQIIYLPHPSIGPSPEQLQNARLKYGGHWDPFEGLSHEELEHIKAVTPNWDAKNLTRKAIWSELTDRNGIPVLRKQYPDEDAKAYSAEKSKCQEWHRIFVLAREIVKELLVAGTTWTDQNVEMRTLAVRAVEQKVEQTRWCQDHWKAQILLDSRLVEWNRSWKDKQAAAEGTSTTRRAKRRRQAKEAKAAKAGQQSLMDGGDEMADDGGLDDGVDGHDDGDDGEGDDGGDGAGDGAGGGGAEGVDPQDMQGLMDDAQQQQQEQLQDAHQQHIEHHAHAQQHGHELV